MRSGWVVYALSLLLLVYFVIWSIFGMYNDELVIFRYTNYFGYYASTLCALLLIINLLLVKKLNIRRILIVPTILVALAPITLPWLIPQTLNITPRLDQISDSESSAFTFVTFSKMSRNQDFKAVAQLIDCKKHDIIAVQEASGLEQELHGALANSSCKSVFSKQGNLAVFSKYPLFIVEELKFGVHVVADNGKEDISIITFRMDKSLTERGAKSQQKQITFLSDYLKKLRTPTVIAGDFNATIHNETIWTVNQYASYLAPNSFWNLELNFPSSARRIGALGPLIRIDHIFTLRLVAAPIEVMDDAYGSDHFPIMTKLALNQTEIHNGQTGR